jgi:hypothetical protein
MNAVSAPCVQMCALLNDTGQILDFLDRLESQLCGRGMVATKGLCFCVCALL